MLVKGALIWLFGCGCFVMGAAWRSFWDRQKRQEPPAKITSVRFTATIEDMLDEATANRLVAKSKRRGK